MPGDYSRLTFDGTRRYTSVRMQQGRVQLDSDWNEQADITRHALETLARDILGDAGVPGDAKGFEIAAVGGSEDGLPAFTIGPGRLYVDGMLCVNDAVTPGDPRPDDLPAQVLSGETAPPAGAARPNPVPAPGQLPNKEPADVSAVEGVPSGAATNVVPAGVAADNKPARDPAYLVYLDAWQQEITAVENPDLREVALGGIDTAAREQTAWQVRLAPFPGDGWRPGQTTTSVDVVAGAPPTVAGTAGTAGSPAAPAGADAGERAAAAAQLALADVREAATQEAASPVNAEPDSQVLDAWRALNTRLLERGKLMVRAIPPEPTEFENQLYRVEVHAAATGAPELKWARDNASVAFEITETALDVPLPSGQQRSVSPAEPPGVLSAGSKLWVSVSDLDQNRHALVAGATVEVVDRVAARSGQTAPLFRVVAVDWSERRVNVEATAETRWSWPASGAQTGLLLRRWDGPPPGAALTGDGWMPLENRLQVKAGGGPHRPGDYWLITTRFGQKLTWPEEASLPPHGPQHHYALLAVLYREGEGWAAADCRPIHAPTTDLTRRLGIAEDDIIREQAERREQVTAEAARLTERIAGLEHKLAERTAALVAVIEQAHESEERLGALEARWFEERTRMHHDLIADDLLEDGHVVALVTEGSGPRGDRGDAYRLVLADRSTAYQVYGVVVPNDSTVATERYPAGERVRVAVYGKVRCKVVGRISPGDLLVPSRRPGFAQRAGIAVSLIRPGTVLGKALTASDPNRSNNQDVIDVMVTLG